MGRGTEPHGRTARLPVGLQALEDFLRVVEHRRGGVKSERPVGLEPGVVPAAISGPADRHHVVGEDLAEPGIYQQPFPLRGRKRVAGGMERKGDVTARAPRAPRAPLRSPAPRPGPAPSPAPPPPPTHLPPPPPPT